MTSKIYTLQVRLWMYPGEFANWYFVTVPKKMSTEIKEGFGKYARGFGSLPVAVTVGKTAWETSIFPDTRSGTYLLPIKAKVRKEEALFADDVIAVSFKVRQ
ncbi:DUF1905 domain-containing protein [Candidatus Kaiserbacteria bacterium]|nr:DUF1905 domain-containing protein [Candidatus Kaiserbacteria bacterium]USN89230.1 MAG: DUF1905 domain-containing protein [Candidatus Nomurabacteria bacterium]